jgi:RNA polymerase sigma-70 factor, ECF subfamily
MVTDTPDTRESLLARVKNSSDHEAWTQFVSLYRPVVYRLARRRGLQDADAQDLAQQVLLAISLALPRWQRQPGVRFRHWLARVARNAILNALTRGPRDQGEGGTTVNPLLEEQPESDEKSIELIDWEYRRELFRHAARQVREEIDASTWQAFWMTMVEEQPIADVAKQLEKSAGSIYAARSRVMRRLRDKIREMEE